MHLKCHNILLFLYPDAIVINADPVGTNHSHAVKIERFTAFLDGHLPIEISDDGTLPGNRLGAAGLDSTFFGYAGVCLKKSFLRVGVKR